MVVTENFRVDAFEFLRYPQLIEQMAYILETKGNIVSTNDVVE